MATRLSLGVPVGLFVGRFFARPILLPIIFTVLGLFSSLSANAQSADWADMALFRPSTTQTTNALCYWDGSYLRCDNTGGLADRIISGTTSFIAYQNTSATIATNGVERLVVGTNGQVGIGQQPVAGLALGVSGTTYSTKLGIATTAPATALDVSGSLRIADGGETCDATIPGAIRYASGSLSYCNGTAWSTLASAASAVTKLDDLSDVEYNHTTQNMFIGTSYSTPLVNSMYNVAVGRGALSSLFDDNSDADYGDLNTAVGTDSLKSTTTGHRNTGVGSNAISKNTTGKVNTAIGRSAMVNNTTGSFNSAVGAFSLQNNIAGMSNSVVGYGAFFSASSVTASVALGYQAGYGVSGSTAYQNNTFLGAYSGDSLTTGSNNTLVGYNTDTPLPTTSNYINIANTIFGDSSTQKVGIGNLTSASLTVSGTLLIADGGQACDATFAGAIRYASGSLSYCNGTAWSTLTSSASAVTKLDDLSDVEYNLTTNNMFIGTSYSTPLVNNINNLSIGRGALAGLTDGVSGTENLAIGEYALNKNTTGYYNLAVGRNALFNNTTGYHNLAIGRSSLYYNTTGYGNLAVGQSALANNTTGYQNLANGLWALSNNTTGYGNLAVGQSALQNNTTGSLNSVVGHWAFIANITGSRNVALGTQAGRVLADGTTSNTTPDYSIYLGADTKSLADDSQNEIVIGYNATGVGSNSVVLGNNSITKTLLKGKVGLGTTAPTTKLDVSGSLRIANGGETCDATVAGAIRYASGSLSYCNGTAWSTLTSAASAVTKLDDLSDTITNYPSSSMYLGEYSGVSSTAEGNTAIGHRSMMYNETGYSNTSLGAFSLYKNTGGYRNTAVGRDALLENITGARNSAFGNTALRLNTTGERNTAVGQDAMYYNSVGNGNVAVGHGALMYAQVVTTSVALGVNAGLGVSGSTAYQNNTFLGAYSGDSLTTGSNNTLVGYNTDTPLPTTSNYINIANTIFGDSSTQKVGIGNLTSASLTVSGTLLIANGGQACDSTFAGAIRYTAGSLSYCNGTAWSTLANAASAVTKLDDLSDVEYNLTTLNMFIGTSYTTPLVNSTKNMGIGYGALAGLTDGVSGTENLAIGDYALNKNTSGYRNLAVGRNALYNNTTGYVNVAVGYVALRDNTTGYNNVAIGQWSLAYNTTGYHNTAVGLSALGENTTGYQNLAVGQSALDSNISGFRNIALGIGSGRFLADGTTSNTTPDNSVYLGAFTKSLADDSQNEIVIGYNAIGAGSNSVVLGNDSITKTLLKGKVGLGTTAPTTKLDVSGSLRIANGGETCDVTIPGAIRYTAGSLSYCNGTAWSTLTSAASAVTKLDDLSDVEYNLTTRNMFIGTSYSTPLVNNTKNMGIGYGALAGLTDGVSGTDNLAIGEYALNKNTIGYYNLAVGSWALNKNTTGYQNQAVGLGALMNNTTGYRNQAVGGWALMNNTTGYQNQAEGLWALYNNTTGYSNLAVGQSALGENISGSRNTALGYNAGRYLADGTTSNTTPDNSTYLGYSTKSLADDSQNEIVIGYNATGAGSNSVVLGNDSITKTLLKGKIGVATTAPATALDVSGSLRIADGGETCNSTIPGAIRYTAGSLSYCNGTAWSTLAATSSIQTDRITSGTSGIYAYTDTSVSIATAGAERMVIGTAGNVGIGAQPVASAALTVSGTIKTNSIQFAGTENPAHGSTCTAADLGRMVLNASTGRMVLCVANP